MPEDQNLMRQFLAQQGGLAVSDAARRLYEPTRSGNGNGHAVVGDLPAPFGAGTVDVDTLEGLSALRERIRELSGSPAGWWFPTTNLWIAGVEMTQAVQSFTFNGQGSGLPANSVPLTANKTLILRVYVNRTTFSWLPVPTTVTGVVSYPGHPNLSPVISPIPATAASGINRGNANQTLLFRVPAAHCTGSVPFTVRVFDPGHPGEASYSSSPTLVPGNFGVVPSMRVHGVLINYTGPGGPIAAPSGWDLVNTLAGVVKVYPISGINYIECVNRDFSGDLRVGGGGGCGTGWNQLFNMVWNMRAASGTNDVFVALLPPGVPTSGVIGCGGGGVAIGYKGDWSTMAQEIGHAFGRSHAPCGNPGSPDPNYPTYDSYPSGSIGEFGFDTETCQTKNPASTYDFMSYCGPVWTSPYTYVGLRNGISSASAAAHSERPGLTEEVRERLYLNFTVNRKGAIELLPSFHLPGPDHGVEASGEVSPVSCELLGAEGDVLASHRCKLNNPHQEHDHPTLVLNEVLPWDEAVSAIAFARDGRSAETLEVEKEAPSLRVKGIKQVEKRPSLVRLEWEAKASNQRSLAYLVRYTNDGGRSWRAVAANLTEARHVVDLDQLPGGDECRFQVLASSGIRTASAESDALSVPVKPRTAHIVSPAADTSYREGEAVVLQGGGFSPDFATSEFDESLWTVDGERCGKGHEVVIDSLAAGRHRVAVQVPDGTGGEATASVWITVEPPA